MFSGPFKQYVGQCRNEVKFPTIKVNDLLWLLSSGKKKAAVVFALRELRDRRNNLSLPNTA